MYENGISFIISLLICGCVKSEEMMKQHFVLVHGSCLGAWCWYKVKPLLEASGHRVTALDLAACGIDTRSITDISTCEQYSEPLIQLMTSLPNDEKVVLVGHSYGGLTLAIAMDKFPDKISVSVFVTSFMPDTKNSPSFVLEKVYLVFKRPNFVQKLINITIPFGLYVRLVSPIIPLNRDFIL